MLLETILFEKRLGRDGAGVDALQTSAIDAVDDYKLKHLADVFNLTPDLIERIV